MTYDDIKKMIEQEVQDKAQGLVKDAFESERQKSLYGVPTTPYHLHTGVDSPQLPFTNLQGVPSAFGAAGQALVVNTAGNGLIFASASSGYPGYVKSDGTHASPYFLPTGWTSSLASHLFTITHNLTTTAYSVVITVRNTAAIPSLVTIGANSFTLQFFDLTGSNVDADFTFILLPR